MARTLADRRRLNKLHAEQVEQAEQIAKTQKPSSATKSSKMAVKSQKRATKSREDLLPVLDDYDSSALSSCSPSHESHVYSEKGYHGEDSESEPMYRQTEQREGRTTDRNAETDVEIAEEDSPTATPSPAEELQIEGRDSQNTHPDARVVGILAEKYNEIVDVTSFAVFWGDMCSENGVTWEDQAWMTATTNRRSHLQDWEQKKRHERAIAVYDLGTYVPYLTVTLWPRPLSLEKEQKDGEQQYARAELLRSIIRHTAKDLEKDLFETVELGRFEFANFHSKNRAAMEGFTTAAETLQYLRKSVSEIFWNHPKYHDIEITYRSSKDFNGETSKHRAATLVFPLFTDVLPRYHTSVSSMLRELKIGTVDIGQLAILACDLGTLLYQMVEQGPYLIGNRHFTLLAYIVLGESRLRTLLKSVRNEYPVGIIDDKLAVWLEVYYERCGEVYLGSKAREDVKYLRRFFDMLEEYQRNRGSL